MTKELTRIEIALPDIVKTFDAKNKRVFTRSEIDEIVAENKGHWRFTTSISVKAFIDYMAEKSKLREQTFDFPRKETRYIWGNAPLYEVVLSLKPKSYLTHYTAMHLHDLTEQLPKTIYLNQEQPSHHLRNPALEQERIDAAFKNRVRVSHEVAEYQNYRICIVHGQHTDGLGVIDLEGAHGGHIRLTNVERTLIDIAVRPVYSGGVHEVLKAYRLAKNKVSVNRMVAMLKKMDYVYPYHQVIGFYLERAGGYRESSIKLLRKMPMEYDFYLEHDMAELAYSKQWRLYFPKGF